MKKKRELAFLTTQEMGKPFQQSLAEIEKCARFCEYVIKQAPVFLKDEAEPALSPENSCVIYQALGGEF